MALTEKHEEFRKLAAEYCDCIEQLTRNPIQTLTAVRQPLLALYAAAFSITELAGETDKNLPFNVSHHSWSALRNQIARSCGADYFQITYHPFKQPPENALYASLSDALADIWRELKPGLLALDLDSPRFAARVVWEWKFGFETHWGDHAVDAIWGIHKLLRDEAG